MGNNHQGKLDEAKALIDMASEAGVDSVKFQMRSMEALYGKQSNKRSVSQDLGVQYTSDLLSKFQLSDDDLFKAFDHCKLNEVEPICTPWDLESLKKLEDYGMEAYKVASADFTNHELLRELAKTHVPLICSTGMSTDDEILESSELLKSLGVQGILLHCNSTYPTPFKDVNLNYIRVLRKFGFDVGYSGHERGNFIPLAAIALGASVIEKHITFNKDLDGNDTINFRDQNLIGYASNMPELSYGMNFTYVVNNFNIWSNNIRLHIFKRTNYTESVNSINCCHNWYLFSKKIKQK